MTSSDTEKKPKKSRLVWVLISVALLAGLVFVFRQPLAGLAFVLTGGSMSMTEAVDNRPLGYFYRFTARYSHKGEPLVFDYVVACNIRVTHYRGGDRSDDSTYAPKVMMQPTKSGGAVMVRTIKACNGQTTENGRVPEGLFPLAIWFDDVNDMTFGWGYATEDAYESELSELEFHDARINSATRADWEAWREASSRNFQPVGMITTPWGMTYNEASYGRSRDQPYDYSKRDVADTCFGYYRQDIPQKAKGFIRKYWQESGVKYWVPAENELLNIQNALHEVRNKNEEGKTFVMGGTGNTGIYGLRRRGNIGEILHRDLPILEVYPMLPRSVSSGNYSSEPASSYPRRLIHKSLDRRGYLACGGDAPVDQALPTMDAAFRSKKHPILVDDSVAAENYNPLTWPPLIFQEDKSLFHIGPAGHGRP